MQIHLKAPQRPAVADGPISLELALRNDSASEAQVPAPGMSEPFEYAVLDSAGEQLVATASRAQREAVMRRMDDLPEFPPQEQSLPPNSALTYVDDMTALLPSPLAPGRYVIEASYREAGGATCRSERVPIEVQTPSPVAIAQTVDAGPESLIVVELHDSQDGSLLLRKRESDHTLLGRFYDMLRFQPASEVRQLAVAVEAEFETPRYWRWVAWIDGGSLVAGAVRLVDFVGPHEAVSLGLGEPVLLSHGYGLRDGSGLFVVAGLQGGQRKIRLVRIPPARGSRAEVLDVALVGIPPGAPWATLVWLADGTPEMLLTWSVPVAGGQEIVQARIDPVTGAEGAGPERILHVDRKLVAIGLPPVVLPGREGALQMVVAPPAADLPYAYASFDLGNFEKRRARHLPALAALPEESVEHWVLPSERYPEAPVLAVSRGEFWVAKADGWRRIAVGEPALESVRLWAFDATTYFCTWFDRVQGYCSVSVR